MSGACARVRKVCALRRNDCARLHNACALRRNDCARVRKVCALLIKPWKYTPKPINRGIQPKNPFLPMKSVWRSVFFCLAKLPAEQIHMPPGSLKPHTFCL